MQKSEHFRTYPKIDFRCGLLCHNNLTIEYLFRSLDDELYVGRYGNGLKRKIKRKNSR